MSFDGDLEHLPIVDVIQLLHATSKSGTLTLRGPKGESQLVFHKGFIVSANHANNSVRIGQILLDMGVITPEELASALHEQQKAGPFRKPIIQTLIEGGRVQTEDAYQGLEVLIEMTIVEVLTWITGSFSLDVDKSTVSDEYRYFPEQLAQEMQLNTQSVLMDALRIYDERKRDGTLTPEAMFGVPLQAPSPVGDGEISAQDLGLDELDLLERRIPQVFSGLSDQEPDTPEKRLRPVLAGYPADEQQQLFGYLQGLAGQVRTDDDRTGVILFSGAPLVRECVSAVCGPRFRCATDDAAALDPIIEQSFSKGRVPLLLVDAGEPGGRGPLREVSLPLLQQKREKYPGLAIVLFACPGDYRLSMLALQAGVSAVLPRASREERPDSFLADTIGCSRALESSLREIRYQRCQGLSQQQFKLQFAALSGETEPAEITFRLLQAVGTVFDRAVTLLLVRSELVAERGIGIAGAGVTSPVKLRVPIDSPSLFQRALAGEVHFGGADQPLRETIFSAIGSPASQAVLLLPVLSFGKVVALIYADFGAGAGGAYPLEILETLALHAGLAIDNAVYRKRSAQKTGV